jgi:hypothetical protein
MLVSFLQATTGLVPIRYRGALLSTLLHVSLLPTSFNRPSAYQLQKSATEPSSTCLIPKSHNMPSTYQSQKSVSEHSSTCKSRSHKPQGSISYRRTLLSTLLHVSLLPTRYNRPSTYQLQKGATEHSSTCKSPSH